MIYIIKSYSFNIHVPTMYIIVQIQKKRLHKNDKSYVKQLHVLQTILLHQFIYFYY